MNNPLLPPPDRSRRCRRWIIAVLAASAIAAAGEPEIHCGQLLWPTQPSEYLPFPEGMALIYSTAPVIATAIATRSPLRVRLVYEDMVVSQRVLQDAVATIVADGRNLVCLRAAVLDSGGTDATIELAPLALDDQPLVFSCQDCTGKQGAIPSAR